MEDEKLVICKSEVFETIFRSYAKELKRFLYFKTGDTALAEDILQDTFVQLWKNCDNVSYEKVKNYLFTVANNQFLNYKKREKLIRAHHKTFPRKVFHETPEFLLLEKEFLVKIEKAIASLTENQQEVFLLNRIEKKKYREIAVLLNVSIKTVEKRMHVALKKMKEQIGRV
jgi:RNA polymerase sigma-70 factor (family 1)